MSNLTPEQELMSQLTVFSKYSRYWTELGRRETYEEIVARNRKMHLDHVEQLDSVKPENLPKIKELIDWAYRKVHAREVFPSMRALADHTPINTKSGWKTVGDVEVGDILYNSRGEETKVLKVLKFSDIDLYDVGFSDGFSIRACGEHLWIVSTADDMKNGGLKRVVDTEYIRTHLKQGDKYSISIENPMPVDYEEQELPVDPYVFGLWLGDGYKTGTQFASGVEDAPHMVAAYEAAGCEVTKAGEANKYAWNFKGLKEKLVELGVVGKKHIPAVYRRSSVQHRISIVQGLMDSDGCCSDNGRTVFSNTNKEIIDGLTEILSSLGIKFTIQHRAPRSERHRESWFISFFPVFTPFRLPRKADKFQERALGNPNRRTEYRKVHSVEPAGKGNATCFVVDSQDSSFLAGERMVVTHNCMQFGGDAVLKNNVRNYNCSHFFANETTFFSELMYLLLCGTGVGYSVRKHHVKQIPARVAITDEYTFTIPDSIEGWADAVRALYDGYLETGRAPVFDYSLIRPRGSLLRTSGGKAPGPEPLRRTLDDLRKMLESVEPGDKLRPIQVHDMACTIARAVLSGGIRRSAMISLFSPDDEEMMNAKVGEWWKINPDRAYANNSAVLLRGRDDDYFHEIFDTVRNSGSGEPGVLWVDDDSFGTNPCAEITLSHKGLCNLSTMNAGTITSQDDFNERARAAAIIGTLQASYTDFPYLSRGWKETAEKEALLGVSMTGIASGAIEYLDEAEASRASVEANREMAALLGINNAFRVNTLKPEGSASLVAGTSSGIHAWHDKFYLRRTRYNKVEPLAQYLIEKFGISEGGIVEQDVFNPDQIVVAIPQKAPEGAATRDEGAMAMLERVLRYNRNWIRPGNVYGGMPNNVSATVNVRDDEWDAVHEWMWNNRYEYNGLSLLPYADHTYVQAPFESIDEATFERMAALVREAGIDLSEVREFDDNTELGVELACAGGACAWDPKDEPMIDRPY